MNEMMITVNGQTYRLSGETAYPVSADVNSEIILRLDKIDSRLNSVEVRLEKLEARVGRIESDLTMLQHDQSTLSTFVYWVLGAVAIFLACLAIPAMIASIIQAFRKPESDNRLTLGQVAELLSLNRIQPPHNARSAKYDER